MERKLFQLAGGLTWLVLPLTTLHYWRAWDRLPVRMAVHFDVNWRPNGWTSREGALMLVLVTTILPLVIFTISTYVMSRRVAVSNLSKWTMVAVFYIALGVVYFVNNWIIDRNLNGGPTPFSELIGFHDLYATTARPHVKSPGLHS
jgi:uncharacterized membrane protein